MEAIRYIITKYRDGILSFTLDSKTGKMESVVFTPSDKNTEDANIGDIFVAKVNNVARQINAAFIDYALGKRGYLPIDMEYAPVITNRPYDGRILAGDEILVQLEKEAVRSKEPVFTTNWLANTASFPAATPTKAYPENAPKPRRNSFAQPFQRKLTTV